MTNERGETSGAGHARNPAIVVGLRWEVLLLAALAGAIYFSRLGAVPLRGEETRWARVAWEMRETGDWVVPRQQGRVFPDRPPLNSWCMVLLSRITGELDRVTVRLPAALATVLTAILVYAYCQQFLTRWGAFAGGLVYATFAQVLQLGRFAESDAVFALLVSASLMVWHSGYVRGWPGLWTFVAGYLLAALAGLAKGPQGPIYFVATVSVFLCLRRDWRRLFSAAHLAGLAIFAVALASWQLPFSLTAGSGASAAIWSEQGYLGSRLTEILGPRFLRHVAIYPLEVLANLLPWSVLLVWYARGRSRAPLGAARPYVAFLAVFLAIALPTCWLVPGTRPRHVMSLYPSVAGLIAVVIDRCCFGAAAERWDRGLRWFLGAMGVLAAGAGTGALVGAWLPGVGGAETLSPKSAGTVAFGAGALALAAIIVWAWRGTGAVRAAMGLGAVGAVLGLSFVVIGIGHLARIADDTEAEVARLKQGMLQGERLVSFGPLFHRFTFYWQDPIEILPWPEAGVRGQAPCGFFCFMRREERAGGKLPFAWEEIATVYCDRAREQGVNHVVIGRPL